MTEDYPEVDPTLSRDATYSSYAAAAVDTEQNPPPGPAVEQTLGKPTEAKASTKAKASSE